MSLFASVVGTNLRVITAIILRETKTRFGKHKFGYIWALIEPILYIGILLTVRSYMGRNAPFGESYVLFMLSGVLMFRSFAAISGRLTNAITANKALLTYPNVRPIDSIVARFALEALTMLIVTALFFIFLSLTTRYSVIYYPDRLVFAFLATSFLGLGVGTFNAVLNMLWPTWNIIWGAIRLPLLILSGIFYYPAGLPPVAKEILWWNPVLHCVEWIRTSVYLDYNDPILSPVYVLSFSTISLTLGLFIERAFRSTIIRV